MLSLVADKSMVENEKKKKTYQMGLEKGFFNRKPDTLFLFDFMHS